MKFTLQSRRYRGEGEGQARATFDILLITTRKLTSGDGCRHRHTFFSHIDKLLLSSCQRIVIVRLDDTVARCTVSVRSLQEIHDTLKKEALVLSECVVTRVTLLLNFGTFLSHTQHSEVDQFSYIPGR